MWQNVRVLAFIGAPRYPEHTPHRSLERQYIVKDVDKTVIEKMPIIMLTILEYSLIHVANFESCRYINCAARFPTNTRLEHDNWRFWKDGQW